jgi:hypothetical protein
METGEEYHISHGKTSQAHLGGCSSWRPDMQSPQVFYDLESSF